MRVPSGTCASARGVADVPMLPIANRSRNAFKPRIQLRIFRSDPTRTLRAPHNAERRLWRKQPHYRAGNGAAGLADDRRMVVITDCLHLKCEASAVNCVAEV